MHLSLADLPCWLRLYLFKLFRPCDLMDGPCFLLSFDWEEWTQKGGSCEVDDIANTVASVKAIEKAFSLIWSLTCDLLLLGTHR